MQEEGGTHADYSTEAQKWLGTYGWCRQSASMCTGAGMVCLHAEPIDIYLILAGRYPRILELDQRSYLRGGKIHSIL